MENKNYTVTIEVAESPKDVFNHVNDVSNWWARDAGEALSRQKTEFEGQSKKLNDEFIIRSGDRHYSKQKLIEVIPDKKVVWQVIDCKINWLEKDKTEWTNTKMVFEITTNGDKTVLQFTHVGLIPEKECYENCERGWDFLIKERLFNFINNGEAK
jgi:Activator of Hsp90 ATPase homolog 1-like protein